METQELLEDTLQEDDVVLKPRKKHETNHKPVRPSSEELAENLKRIDAMLGIDAEDYRPMSREELQRRINGRIEDQDKNIYPQRAHEQKLTPEWRRYAAKRLERKK